MIKEEYVSFEVAKLLKERGFEEETIGVYYVGGNRDGEFEELTLNNWNKHFKTPIAAPTQQMAMRWLRERRCIFFTFDLCLGKRAEKGLYQIGVYENVSIETYRWRKWILGDTYEETYDKAIKYSLENFFKIR